VIATARSTADKSAEERLAPLKAAGAAVLEIDVKAPKEELNAKAKEAWSIYGQIDVLVNNAGYIDAGILEEIE
jgi:NAD(P)-dependent dehydrogenase (short-subunit alcohol dehydrogenase family)